MSTDQLSLFGGAPAEQDEPAALPDRAARDRIREDLHTSLLVEAGAGAGKTTEMVRRMVALVRSGTARVEEVAAVTFTRKAAAELRQRFQTELERDLREAVAADAADATVARLDTALRQIDRAFLGTIHAFCARLLRERPLDAGLDPAFRETLGAEEVRLRRRFWNAHIERLVNSGDASLHELRSLGLQPRQLDRLFEELAGQPDVLYEAPPAPRPHAGELRRRLESIMDRAATLVPADGAGGGDALQRTLRTLRFRRFVVGWSDDARFMDAIASLGAGSFRTSRRRWTDGDAAKAVEADLTALFADGGPAGELLHDWWAHRYPAALAFADAAARAWEHERAVAGTLNFQDLLMLAARLLRESPAARRELSERYRFLLVDEFQDTDPIQAEVLFLLASDEELELFAGDGEGGAVAPAFAAWRHLTPRPGALFVVGDPKQSIYRFRRADMTLYRQVRRRFESFGGVVELVANFRSCKPIERFVNETFGPRFPGDGTEVQARFAPMLVQEREQRRDPPRTGVFWYELDDPVHGRVPQLAKQDSERLAAWIAARIAAGERRPGDFLVLTPTTKWLGSYAAALEARGVPVQVSGSGAAGADNIELAELRVLLRALADPGDPSLTVAVLVGLFFGLDYEQLVAHAETWNDPERPDRRAPFSFTSEWADPATPAEEALARLHRFRLLCRRQPADLAVPRIVEELGVLPFAASGELGGSRSGALLYALDSIRAAALNGDASLSGALAALETALAEDDSEAPLEPGRADAVRVMNLHKAKGLEAAVVILAMPFGAWSREPASRIVREPTGHARGHAIVTERRGRKQPVTIARPADWPEHAAIEESFIRAEAERLLYVAATRAADELIVGCAYNANSPSPWRSFHGWLKEHAQRIELPPPRRPARRGLQTTAEQVAALLTDAAARRRVHGTPTYRAAPVTERKRDVIHGAVERVPAGAEDTTSAAAAAARGTDWGRAVHDALQLAMEGLDGDALAAACRSTLIALERPLDEHGAPRELDELLALVAAVRESPLWRRAGAAQERLVEVPFAVRFTAAEYAGALGAEPAALPDLTPVEIVEGRIDLVFRDDGGWVIVDYKSDAAGTAVSAPLMRGYERQLALYAAAWERLAGEPVAERHLLFTATGEILSTAGAAAAR